MPPRRPDRPGRALTAARTTGPHSSPIPPGCPSGSADGRRAPFRHNDTAHLARRIEEYGPGVIAVDSIYSVCGSLAPLGPLCELAEESGCVLVVDEAHSLGTHGPAGAGMVAEAGLAGRVHFRTMSLSKAFAKRAGYITCPDEDFVEYFKMTSYPAVFASTWCRPTWCRSPPPWTSSATTNGAAPACTRWPRPCAKRSPAGTRPSSRYATSWKNTTCSPPSSVPPPPIHTTAQHYGCPCTATSRTRTWTASSTPPRPSYLCAPRPLPDPATTHRQADADADGTTLPRPSKAGALLVNPPRKWPRPPPRPTPCRWPSRARGYRRHQPRTAGAGAPTAPAQVTTRDPAACRPSPPAPNAPARPSSQCALGKPA
ncbi:aminotransferase class I/II-fold pyridoxal phosphate-dependent enzyme [Streptomyces toxytricini]|uniref:8-amino-7-oxononanoate synthase n=1 Tax=Streptomyces toxytricini TaxID=67369 RepID=A0ABW8ERD6_STRT5